MTAPDLTTGESGNYYRTRSKTNKLTSNMSNNDCNTQSKQESITIEDERGYIDKSTTTLFRATSILDEDKIRSDDKVTLTSILSEQHIPNVLIQDFHGTKQEDVVAWIDQLEVALDLTDHAHGKWSKLAAWYLEGEALSWYIKNKNQVYDWDSFRQMIVEKYPTCDNHHIDLIKLEQAIPSSTTILNTKSISTIDLANNLLKTLMEIRFPAIPPSNDREILRQLAGRKQAWNEPISRFYRGIMNL
ncbi:unnamed protein product [Didymodactylos carnosus]|uniref:Ty3 transposon capsid-like protein domain-containing protein n=1 Tax=Didymodactylos carnosus TaxID=1234261 RepID=A0A814P8Z1_9BILA|nr:unnamed protein product [Didymodactylos carnosus]CAF1504527.1 unnamed protein product [Didymodactylos carnosus]CAF3869244.1 unnamed protein product [Didymodactylos carnosus]CAF4292781.1 unnamed protein product [Didymodactylos carnosus]